MHHGPGVRILVADDEPSVVAAIREVLLDLGAEVLQASDGREALSRARAERPDLVLLDIKMPAMDGFEVAEAMQRDPDTAGIPVVFFSATDDTRDKVRGLGLAEDYVSKPIDGEELKARVRKVLQRSGAAAPDASSGKLTPRIVATLLRTARQERRSGRLLLAHGTERGEIHFHEGAIVRAIQGPRLGDAAVYQLLTWQDGIFEIAPPEAGWVGGEVASESERLLGEGLRRRDGIADLRKQVESSPGRLLVPAAIHRAAREQLSPAVASLLHLLDGSRDLRRVLAESPLDVWHSLTVLVSLHRVGALTARAAEPDRRHRLRFKVDIPIEYQAQGLWQEASTFNLSAWGVFIRTAVPFDTGEEVLLRFWLPQREAPMTVTGHVVWANADPSRSSGMGMGIQFHELPGSDRDAIEAYLAQLVASQLAEGGEPAPE
jgi:uncharacterized protein (TIGR02266 family)